MIRAKTMAPAMAPVVRLRPVETLRLDPARLAELYRDLGAAGTDSLLSRALARMAERMESLSRRYASAELTRFGRELHGLRRLADHTGFLGLSLAAAGVSDCLAAGDATALGATWARLSRLAAEAAACGGDLRDLRG